MTDDFEGSTSAGHTITQFSDAPCIHEVPREDFSSSFEARQRARVSPKERVFFQRWSEVRRRTQSAPFPQSGRAVDGNPGPSRQVGGSIVGPRRKGSCGSGIEGDVNESSNPSAGPTSARSGGTDRSISGPVTEEIGVNGCRNQENQGGYQGVGGQDPRRGTSIGCLAIRYQGAIESFHCRQRSTRGDSSIAIEDCKEIPTKRSKTLAVSSLDLVPSQGGCFDVQFDRPSRRVDEAVRVVVGARDSFNGLRGVQVGEASNPGPRNLFLRRSRAVRASPAIESTAIDHNTTVGSMPKTHLLTDSDDVEGVASSGFLRMFAQDMAESGGLPPAWLTAQLDENQEKSRNFVKRHDAVPSRRVVLVPQSPQGTPQSFGDRFSQKGSGGLVLSQAVVSDHIAEHSVHEDEVGLPSSDTETVGPVTGVSMQAPSAVSKVVPSVEAFIVSQAIRDALLGLYTLDVGNIFKRRPSVMRSPPKFLCGAYRSAVRVALLEKVKGAERRDEGIQCPPVLGRRGPCMSRGRRQGHDKCNGEGFELVAHGPRRCPTSGGRRRWIATVPRRTGCFGHNTCLISATRWHPTCAMC